MGGSYQPMVEFEVTLRVQVPQGDSTPLEWDWADLTDTAEEDIAFHSMRVVRSYNRDLDGDTICLHCGQVIHVFDKAPGQYADENRQGWATDRSGDVLEDFICPRRESSGRWPHGKPHEPKEEA